MAMLILFLLLPVAIILCATLSERKRKKRMVSKKEAMEAANTQPPAKQGRMVIPEIMAELNAMSEALDISGYALEAFIGMERTAREAAREARKGGNDRASPSGYAGYGPPGGGATRQTQPAYYEDDLDDWHFSDDSS